MGKRIDNTTCHCLKIRRSAGNVVSFYDQILRPCGITVRQYSLLYSISANDGCNVRELSEYTELDRSTLARSLKPLIKANLIADAKDAGARDSKLSLTEQGRQVCQEAARLWEIAQRRFEEKLGPEQVKALEAALEILQAL